MIDTFTVGLPILVSASEQISVQEHLITAPMPFIFETFVHIVAVITPHLDIYLSL